MKISIKFKRAAVMGMALAVLAASGAGVMAGETIVGWRGNWTGKFPDANPPVKWGKVSKQMMGLRCQVEKPKDNEPSGTSAYEGTLKEWLILGPFPSEGGEEAVEEKIIKDELTCEPSGGEKVNGAVWRKIKTPGSIIDFATIFSKELPDAVSMDKRKLAPIYRKQYVAYACTYVYSPQATELECFARAYYKTKIYINNKLVCSLGNKTNSSNAIHKKVTIKLKRGWNRILYKSTNLAMPTKKYTRMLSTWFVDMGLRAIWPYETETENIKWTVKMPFYHIANPLIVGDKIFVMSNPGDLICVNKSDGKIRWIRSITYCDVASKQEKQDPAFKNIASLVKELKDMNAMYVRQNDLSPEILSKRIGVYGRINSSMGKINKEKYSGKVGHYAHGNLPTPVSDGKNVYVWLGSGIAACYDLDGNRKWISIPSKVASHGRYASTIIAAGKLIVKEDELTAFDINNGSVVWKLETKYGLTTPVLLKVGNDECIFQNFYVVRASDGKIIYTYTGEGIKTVRNPIATPVIENGFIYNVGQGGIPFTLRILAKDNNISLVNENRIGKLLGGEKIAAGQQVDRSFAISSPLYHEGLLYSVDIIGNLFVMDTKEQRLVYKQDLGLGKEYRVDFYHVTMATCYASLMLAGKYIYVFGANGTIIVFEPGKVYKEVARSKMETPFYFNYNWRLGCRNSGYENFAGSPVAEGNYIYVRGSSHLYCIGEVSEKN